MTEKNSPPKKSKAPGLAERLRNLADELDAATGKAPKPMTDEEQIEAAIAQIIRPGSLMERLAARRKAKAEAASESGGGDGAPASPPASPKASKPKAPTHSTPKKPRKPN